MKKRYFRIGSILLLVALSAAPVLANLYKSNLICDSNGDGIAGGAGDGSGSAAIGGAEGGTLKLDANGFEPNQVCDCGLICAFGGGVFFEECQANEKGEIHYSSSKGAVAPANLSGGCGIPVPIIECENDNITFCLPGYGTEDF